MSDETATPTETAEPSLAEALAAELGEETETVDVVADTDPAPALNARERVALKKARKLERAAHRANESAQAALAATTQHKADLEWVAACRAAKASGDHVELARLVELDGETFVKQSMDRDTPEYRAEKRWRELEAEREEKQRQALAQQSTGQREYEEKRFVAESKREPALAAMLSEVDEYGEPMLSAADLLSLARRVGGALQRKQIEAGEDGRVSNAAIISALAKRFAKAQPGVAPEKRPAIKPVAGEAKARVSGSAEPPEDPRDMRAALRALLDSHAN
tara:strand:+ start:175 stop:1011 length:837 start_codon:yes stop_codon:yes gene_type:complete